MVGTSGAAEVRFADVTPRARSLPDFTLGISASGVRNSSWASCASTAWMAAPPPL